MERTFIDTPKKYIEAIWRIASIIFFLIVHNVRWLRRNYKQGMSKNLTCLSGKTAIVTGGNSGIGYMTSMLLASRGCRVIIACRRNAEKERGEIIKETDNPNISVKHLDLSKLSSVRQFAESLKTEESKIDILINNAGVGYSQNMVSDDGLDMVLQTNYFGHFLLTHLLIDLLKASEGARVVFLSSGLAIEHHLNLKNLYPQKDLTVSNRLRSYTNSKACNILAAQEMNKKLEKYGITVTSADPGIVRTPIFDVFEEGQGDLARLRRIFNCLSFLLATDPRRASETILHLAASKDVEGGLNYFRCEPLPKPRGLENEILCEQIWKESEKIVKLRFEEKF